MAEPPRDVVERRSDVLGPVGVRVLRFEPGQHRMLHERRRTVVQPTVVEYLALGTLRGGELTSGRDDLRRECRVNDVAVPGWPRDDAQKIERRTANDDRLKRQRPLREVAIER